MNKLLTTITLLCFSVAANAQEKEVWACQQEASTMLSWENNRWVQKRLYPETLLLTINGYFSFITQSDRRLTMSCEAHDLLSVVQNSDQIFRCIAPSSMILLNTETGQLGMTDILGAVSKTARRDTVSVKIFNCIKA